MTDARKDSETEYREFVLSDIGERTRDLNKLQSLVDIGDLHGIVTLLADDLCRWGLSLENHLLHHRKAVDAPGFQSQIHALAVAGANVCPAQWLVRNWIGGEEAFYLIEHRHGEILAERFSSRLTNLNNARLEFADELTARDADGPTSMEEFDRLDARCKGLMEAAFETAHYLETIASQFRTSDSKTDRLDGSGEAQNRAAQPFLHGRLAFFPDRVELCGVDICSGSRSKAKRQVLELLAKVREDGSFVTFSGDELAAALAQEGISRSSAASLIRDLRRDIQRALLEGASIACGWDDVIQSGGPGYRFAASVLLDKGDVSDHPMIGDIGDIENVPNVPVSPADARKSWILAELADGRQLTASAIAAQFSCTRKTALRDLDALKDEGKIEFVGPARTGAYRLIGGQ